LVKPALGRQISDPTLDGNAPYLRPEGAGSTERCPDRENVIREHKVFGNASNGYNIYKL